MSSFESSTHRLAGSIGEEGGGLIIKPKKKGTNSDGFKKPSARGSLLGLDLLAKKKREERGENAGFAEKKPRLEEGDPSNYDSDVRISFGKAHYSGDRQYRSLRVDTPSHPGGVNEEVLERIQSRLKRDQKHGVFATSKDAEGDKLYR